MSAIPRVVISAPSSGHGKTAISVGLLAALTSRGLSAAGFKIGPDYVDAAYLGLAAGRPGRNLDPRLVGSARLGPLLAGAAAGAEIAVVEGTMGLYDGLAGRTDAESTAQVAGLLRAPVVLVVDAAAMGQSVAALVHGFRVYDELLWLGGVILNRIASDRHEQVLREALGDIGVPVLGALRRRALSALGPNGAPLPPRHEGVGPVAQGSLEAERAVRRLGEVMTQALDLDRLLALARSAPRLAAEPWSAERAVLGAPIAGPPGADPAPRPGGRRPVVAVAGGPCLTFGYAETIELLTAAGADVVTIDPIRDPRLPNDVDALVIGGGLPEAYAEELSFNEGLRNSVRALARTGRPVVAEGAGLVWLCREFAGRPMCGVFDATARVSDMVVLGYREATAVSGSVLMPAGTRVTGHKLHRTLVSPRAGREAAWTWAGGPQEGFVQRGVHASYLSLHWAGHPEIATRLVQVARRLSAASTAPAPIAAPTAPAPAPIAAPTAPAPAPIAAPTAPAPAAPTMVTPVPAAPTVVAPVSAAPTAVVPVSAAPTVVAPVSAAPTTPAPAAPTVVVPAPAAPTVVVPAPAAPTVVAPAPAAAVPAVAGTRPEAGAEEVETAVVPAQIALALPTVPVPAAGTAAPDPAPEAGADAGPAPADAAERHETVPVPAGPAAAATAEPGAAKA